MGFWYVSFINGCDIYLKKRLLSVKTYGTSIKFSQSSEPQYIYPKIQEDL